MHHTVNYTGTKSAKRTAAIADCMEYLGTRRFNDIRQSLTMHLRDRHYSLKAIRFCRDSLSMAGVQGYPATQFALLAARMGKSKGTKTEICKTNLQTALRKVGFVK